MTITKENCGSALHRRLLALAAAALLVAMVVLAGCSGSSNSASQSDTKESVAAEKAAAESGSGASAEGNGTQEDEITVNLVVLDPHAEDAVFFDGAVSVLADAVVIDAFNETALNFTVEDSSYGPYLTSIEGVGAQGTSGWVYTLNGEEVTVGAGEQGLSDGDTIQWSYVDMAA